MEWSHECIQMCGRLQIFTIQQTWSHYVQYNPGYNTITSSNCTSNSDYKRWHYITSFIWKCEVPICTHRCLASLYDKVVFITLIVSSLKYRVPVILIYSKKIYNFKDAQFGGGMGHLLVLRGASSERLCQNPYGAVKRRPRALISCIACYCRGVQFRYLCPNLPFSTSIQVDRYCKSTTQWKANHCQGPRANY